MSTLDRRPDVILVDVCNAHPQGFSPFGLVAQETVIVLAGNGASITKAYALIKKLSRVFAQRHFRILVNKVRNLADAKSIYDNIARVAAQRGVARLDYVAAIPVDDVHSHGGGVARPILLQAPDSEAANILRTIASDMLYWPRENDQLSEGVESFVLQMLNLSHRMSPNLMQA